MLSSGVETDLQTVCKSVETGFEQRMEKNPHLFITFSLKSPEISIGAGLKPFIE